MVTLQGGEIGSVEISRVANTQRTVPLDHGLLTMARDIGICLGEPGRLSSPSQPATAGCQ
jgi:6-phosphofructokinase 1